MKTKNIERKITPKQHFFDFGLSELWARRQLLAVLVGRDLQVRYKNTFLGVAWVILQPLLSTLIFTLIFSRIIKLEVGENNYLVYTMLGFVFWQFFSLTITQASTSVYEQIGMVKKIYFPRLYLPLTVVLRALFDFCVATIFFLAVMWWQQVPLTLTGALGYVLGLGLLLLLTSGLSFAFSSLNARYRDFRHLIPFLIQIWFYLTPVFYAAQMLGEKLSWLLTINPVAQILILVRTAVFQGTINWLAFAGQLALVLGVLIVGTGIFKKWETEMVDLT